MESIVNKGFTPNGLMKLDCYAEQFISGRLIYKRFSPIEQHGCSTGGSCHVIASLLAGAKVEADYGSEGINDFKRESQCGAQQAQKNRTMGQGCRGLDSLLYEKMGFELRNPRNWTFATPEIYLSDMYDENVIKSAAGTFFVIVCYRL